ncbi:DNA mismatch repair endonuclease MutL [Psychrobacter sp. AOP22-C1-22]|uniref:DNA mismatch repair endonuclease MutL n=1 Tax=unclassified Psychrobacter TaxID=196806 RepID=UPI001788914C|nr:DNA mismatch repair endonuclease MutL [Psychrobacter sp. FME6]MBE0406542.1 ATP-binding protein [Psychrobacter sp. FME6]
MPDNDSNTRIKKLSPLLINQLAAGEVVTRPAAVVKELLENAIDANATNIEIHITQGGMSMIEVIDNGVGIHADDMVMAITRHATSKVADVANLHGITTLGFRGEALAATAAVSRLTLTSSHDNSGVGRQLQVAGVLDDVPKLIPVVHQRGTTITVKDLYFNVPARRGNLKSIATEFGHIETIVREVALARADVALTLFHDNKKRLSLSSRSVSSSASGNGNDTANRLPLSRLEQATGIPLKDNALKIAIDLSSLMHQSSKYTNHSVNKQAGVDGWLWPITGSQHTVPKLIYVNGRLVKEALISNQLRQLAQAAQLAGIGYALYFELPTEWLNINVHPSKQRIKITSLNNIMAHLNHAIQSKLKNIAATEQAAINDKQSKQIIEKNTLISNEVLDATDNRVVKKNYKNTAIPYQNKQENRQVKAPKQSYQLAESATDAALRNTVNSSDQISIRYDALPHCLDIITDLNNIAIAPSLIKGIDYKTLPWLLFYSQKQYFLIGAEDWQSKVSLLYESDTFKESVFEKKGLFSSTADINQHLATLGAQMSVQDFRAFTVDLKELLSKHALKTIDSSQLVALLLSSAPE